MSDSIVAGPSSGFDEIDRDILRKMRKLGVYASYQNDTACSSMERWTIHADTFSNGPQIL